MTQNMMTDGLKQMDGLLKRSWSHQITVISKQFIIFQASILIKEISSSTIYDSDPKSCLRILKFVKSMLNTSQKSFHQFILSQTVSFLWWFYAFFAWSLWVSLLLGLLLSHKQRSWWGFQRSTMKSQMECDLLEGYLSFFTSLFW